VRALAGSDKSALKKSHWTGRYFNDVAGVDERRKKVEGKRCAQLGLGLWHC